LFSTSLVWFLFELVARASRGQLPGDLFGQSVTVALATAEDAISQVVVPRLIAAEADLDRVRIIQVRREGTVGGLALPDDIDKLREQLIAAEARIVVVDPLVAHIVGSINTWKDQDVRRVLAPLAHPAEEADAAVVGVMPSNGQRGLPLARYTDDKRHHAERHPTFPCGPDGFGMEAGGRCEDDGVVGTVAGRR